MLRLRYFAPAALAILVIATFSSSIHPVIAFVGPDFTIATNPTSIGPIQPGMRGVSNIRVVNNGTAPETVILTNSTSAGLGCSLTPASLVIATSANMNATLSCGASAPGTYTANVTGTNGPRFHSVLVTFVFKMLVNLDAASLSPTDIIVTSSATQTKSFRVGAVLNATAANPVANVAGWQFEIDYNATAFVPQGDPSLTSSYPDGASGTVLFGAQTTLGSANWAALISATQAFGSFTKSVAGSAGQVTVFFAIIAPNPAVTLSARTLLANVNFELINKPTAPPPQKFTVSNVAFSDPTPQYILSVASGAGANDTIANSPPSARFTVTALLKGDTSCVAITGANCSAYAFKFDGSTSSDPENGTIVNPTGFFWDFGDGTQDNVNNPSCGLLICNQGSIAIHDYGVQGQYVVTLRVVDGPGATGAARDGLGNVIVNLQPSHRSLTVVAANGFSIIASPSSLSIGPNSVGPIGTSTITLTSVNSGFSGTISLSAASKPSGPNSPTFSFDHPQVLLKVGGTNSSTLTVSIGSNTPHLDYNITVSAAIGQIINNVTIRVIPTTITVQPAIVTGTLIGNTFKVDVTTSAANLFGWQFQMNYNSTILSTSKPSVVLGNYWLTASSQGQAFIVKEVNQTAGKISLAVTLLLPAVPFTGNGTLASITFTVNAKGVTPLKLSNDILVNALGGGTSISFSQRNGVFCNISCLNHDVAVTSVKVNTVTIDVGGSVTISAVVTNIGLNPENVTVTFKAGTISISSKQVLLDPGNSTTVTAGWNTTGVSPGSYTIIVQATLVGATDDNSANNVATQTLTLNQQSPGLPIVYIAGGIAAAAAVGAGAFLLMKRRKKPMSSAPASSPSVAPTGKG